MICQKCQADVKTGGFRVSTRIKCQECGASYYPQRHLDNFEQAKFWYLGLFVFIFTNPYLHQYCKEHYPSVPGLLVAMIYGGAIFGGLSRFRPQYTETEYIHVQELDYPLARQDAVIVGSIFVALIIITIGFVVL